MVEVFGHHPTKQPARAAGADAPCFDLLGVGPHEITKRTLMRYFLQPHDSANLVERAQLRAQTTVYAQNAAINDSCNVEIVKHLAAAFPHGGASILLHAFICRLKATDTPRTIETVHLRDLPTLVVPTEQGNAIRESRLERHQQRKRFKAKITAIDKIALTVSCTGIERTIKM